MGLLSLGTPLAWEDAQKLAGHTRFHGITQFLHTWDRVNGRRGDELFSGDKVLRCGPDQSAGVLTVS